VPLGVPVELSRQFTLIFACRVNRPHLITRNLALIIMSRPNGTIVSIFPFSSVPKLDTSWERSHLEEQCQREAAMYSHLVVRDPPRSTPHGGSSFHLFEFIPTSFELSQIFVAPTFEPVFPLRNM
jgi:hypothetical protein